MADVGIGIKRVIQDVDGETATVTNNKLDVNATLVAGATIDIGDVDLFLDGGTALVGGNGTATAGTLRVTIASDTTGVLSVDDNGSTLSIDDGGGSITVDGSVTMLNTSIKVQGFAAENLAAASNPVLTGGRYDNSARTLDDGDVGAVALNASGHLLMDVVDGGQLDALLDTIKVDTEAIQTAVELLDNAISGSEMQVDVVASLPAGTNAMGKVGHDITGMVSDRNTDVGTSAEKIHAAADVAIKRIDIMASNANTGAIYVGDSGVAGNGSGGGISLLGGDFYSLETDNTADVYVSAEVNGEDVYYIYYT